MPQKEPQGSVVRVLTAVNQNPKYQSCVGYFEEFWAEVNTKSQNTYLPTVIQIGQEVSLPEIGSYQIDGSMNTVFAAQFIRNLAPSLYADADFVMTTDVDMVPLNSRFYDVCTAKLQSAGLGEKSQLLIARDVLPAGQFPICYSLARPSTWSEISGVRTLEELRIAMNVEWLNLSARNKSYSGEHGGSGWFYDQEWIYQRANQLAKSSSLKITRLNDRETSFRRLDRHPGMHLLRWLQLLRVRSGYYADYHLHHPVSEHRQFIGAVLRELTKTRD